jgi:hypothetical protein
MWHAWGKGEVFIGFRLTGPKERPRRRWECSIKMDLREIRTDGANCIWLARERVHWRSFVNTRMNLRVP